MNKYTQGICQDGAAILKDGVQMTVEEILAELERANRWIDNKFKSGNSVPVERITITKAEWEAAQ